MKNLVVAMIIVLASGTLTACSVHPAVRAVDSLSAMSSWTAPGSPPFRDCTGDVPADLVAALAKRYPGYRLPVQTNSYASNVAADINGGGSGCLGIASADFDGDRTADFAMILAKPGGDGYVLVAARHTRRGWAIHEFFGEDDGLAGMELRIAKPGHHQTYLTPADIPNPEPDLVFSITTRTPGFYVGIVESEGSEYYYTRRQGWVCLPYG